MNPKVLRQLVDGPADFRWSVTKQHLTDAADEIDRLTNAIRHIDRLLRVEAAEYVPAIGQVFYYIDRLELPCEYCDGCGSIKVDFEHPQWIPCVCRQGQQAATHEQRNEEAGR